MNTKSSSIRFSENERAMVEAYMQGQRREMNFSDAVRELVTMGVRMFKAKPAKSDLRAILKEIDPTWTGRKPRLPPPLRLRTNKGGNPVDEVLGQGRSR